ncbi:hypothetical protein QVD17_37970 [Tagetes erecta]|uniref:Uncharacterized protein n=1 Tax=Tagetes erecta TaxID=13708 RepID=A0AAD8NKA7_TARER|nr:hypothetical protein QVD17_37970 [Tagetes erecta]
MTPNDFEKSVPKLKNRLDFKNRTNRLQLQLNSIDSDLWKSIEKGPFIPTQSVGSDTNGVTLRLCKLLTNMHLSVPGLNDSVKHELDMFSKWLLSIGDGITGITDNPRQPDLRRIDIPSQFCYDYDDNGLNKLINFVYDNDVVTHPTAYILAQRAIRCPKNEFVNEINDLVLNMCNGDLVFYYSTDSMVPHSVPMEKYDFSHVTNGGRAYPLKVRLIRKWNPSFRAHETCFLFVDTQGYAIQGNASGSEQKPVEEIIVVGSCYLLTRYGHGNPDKHSNILTHSCNLVLGRATRFEPIADDEELPREFYDIANRNRMEAACDKDNQVVVIRVNLWEEVIKSLDRYPRPVLEVAIPPRIVAMTALKVKSYAVISNVRPLLPLGPEKVETISSLTKKTPSELKAILSDSKGSMDATVFDEALTELLNQPCSTKLYIKVLKGAKSGIIRCDISRIIYMPNEAPITPVKDSTQASSSRTLQKTQAAKENPVKRALKLIEDVGNNAPKKTRTNEDDNNMKETGDLLATFDPA